MLSEQLASDQNTSSRPSVGQFVDGKEKERLNGASLAADYQYGNGWRTEGEYTFRKKSDFTSGSTAFPTSFNHLKLNTERLMLNIYRDYDIGYDVSLFGTAGLGIARVKAGGWQGNILVNMPTARKIILHIRWARASATHLSSASALTLVIAMWTWEKLKVAIILSATYAVSKTSR